MRLGGTRRTSTLRQMGIMSNLLFLGHWAKLVGKPKGSSRDAVDEFLRHKKF